MLKDPDLRQIALEARGLHQSGDRYEARLHGPDGRAEAGATAKALQPALQPRIGPRFPQATTRRFSRIPALVRGCGPSSSIRPRESGNSRAQALPGDPNHFAINGFGLSTASAHGETVGVAMPVLSASFRFGSSRRGSAPGHTPPRPGNADYRFPRCQRVLRPLSRQSGRLPSTRDPQRRRSDQPMRIERRATEQWPGIPPGGRALGEPDSREGSARPAPPSVEARACADTGSAGAVRLVFKGSSSDTRPLRGQVGSPAILTVHRPSSTQSNLSRARHAVSPNWKKWDRPPQVFERGE